jgi:hypothetical protein
MRRTYGGCNIAVIFHCDGRVDPARNSAGPSSAAAHTGRNEREIALAGRLAKR